MPENATLPKPGEGAVDSGDTQTSPGSHIPSMSVIIPTYNRRIWLGELLDTIAAQSFPFEQFEVIIVDDGSTDNTREIERVEYPFRLRYFFQPNQGDAAARNLGARQSQAEILVFLDDDILLGKDFLARIVEEQRIHPNGILVGADTLWVEDTHPSRVGAVLTPPPSGEIALVPIPFADVCSNNMSIRREAYFALGMMEGLNFPGSSIWCDVDFTYRAYQKNFEFLRNRRALCWHRDYVAKSLQNRKKRMHQVAYRAVALFQKYPELVYYLPMFSDKTPLDWKQDSFGMIVRKLVRQVTSSSSVLWLTEKLYTLIEKRASFERVEQALSRWIVGGHIFRGYRDGLRDFGPVQPVIRPSMIGSVENKPS